MLKVYELLDNSEHNGLQRFIKSRQVLETYLWEHFPMYALEHNACKMSGHGGTDLLENLLKELGAGLQMTEENDERKSKQRTENRITYCKELAGQEVLLLP